MTPVDGNGARDAGREILYIGETQVMSQMGALPINFVLEAKSLEEAAKMFGPAAKAAHRAHGEGTAGAAPPAGLLDRRAAGRPAADAPRGRRQDPDALSSGVHGLPERRLQTSSHSLRIAAFSRTSRGVPSKTMRPWPIT